MKQLILFKEQKEVNFIFPNMIDRRISVSVIL